MCKKEAGMRKREKEKILSLLGSMAEAHQTIQAFLREEKGEEAISLLSLRTGLLFCDYCERLG